MGSQRDRIQHLDQFYQQNEEFQLLHFDFYDPQKTASLNWAGLDQEGIQTELKAYQRVMRVYPDQQVAKELLEQGLDSAHKIAAIPEHRFVREYAQFFQGDETKAKEAHQRAVHIKTAIRQVYGVVKDMIASPHYRAANFSTDNPELDSYYQNIPSYQDLFGSLDYLECEECLSIFSPAAYFLDLMRITDEYITDPNLNPVRNIPDGYTLRERRPDLFDLKLTCANTFSEIPYVQVVNRVLQKKIEERKEKEDAYQVLATAKYPFSLPYERPPSQIRVYLQKLGTSVSELYQTLQVESGAAEQVLPLDTAREALGLTMIQFERVTRPDKSETGLTEAYGYELPISRYLPQKMEGKVRHNANEEILLGNGTRFTKDVAIGDRIQVGNEVRMVAELLSDTQLKVDRPWKTVQVDNECTKVTKDGLDVVDVFLKRTGLTREELDQLIHQNLSPQEWKDGVGKTLYINATEEELPPLRIHADDHPIQRISGLSLDRLDRLNRFIRLAKKLGWSYADLNWAMAALQAKEITPLFIQQVAALQQLHKTTELSLEALTACLYPMKTIGRGNDQQPQDFFDRVFNNPILLHGENPYKNDHVPFHPFRVPAAKWKIEDESEGNGIIRNRLRAALTISNQDLTTVAVFVHSLAGEGEADTLSLTLDNLSWLYRITMMSRQLDLTIDEYLNLLGLLFYPERDYRTPGKDALQPTLDVLTQTLDAAAWAQAGSYDLYQLKYLSTGKTSPAFQQGYEEKSIAPFISNLAMAAKGSHLQPNQLKAGSLTTEQADQLYQLLISHEIISEHGIFRKYEFVYENAATLVPLELHNSVWFAGYTERSFVTMNQSINLEESGDVYTALLEQEQAILVRLESGITVLSSHFTEKTDLSFLLSLFAGDENKVDLVRSHLLQTRQIIGRLLELWQKTMELQKSYLVKGMVDFLQGTIPLTEALLPFASTASGLREYLVSFLTPSAADQEPSPQVISFIDVLARLQQLAELLELNPVQAGFITTHDNAKHFGIKDLVYPSFAEMKLLSAYKKLVKAFADDEDRLLSYFSEKDREKKLAILAEATGWQETQIGKVIDYFWSNRPTAEKPEATVAGLVRMKSVFDQASLLGASVDVVLKYGSLSHLGLTDEGGKINQQNWEQYDKLAQASIDLLQAKYGEERFAVLNREAVDQIHTLSRDSLLSYALWIIHKQDERIATPADLFKYLLIDVEMGSCATTSLIAQGIASVQLYMQRARMMLEEGIVETKVPTIWWTWVSNYRLWEANRKIFLYPENYIDPTLRKTATPDFQKLSDDILQNNITHENVEKPFQDYISKLLVLGSLEHVASYHCRRIDPRNGEEKDTVFFFGRTNTQPYTYYFRFLDNGKSWGPWEEIKLSIPAQHLSPVYAFGRLFIFWTEFDIGKSNAIKNQESSTQTVNKASLKYSFLNHGEWVPPQTLLDEVVINAYPANYDALTTEEMKNLLNENNHFWQEPYALTTGTGIVGAGKISFSEGAQIVRGELTQFDREIRPGDRIRSMGEERVVAEVKNATTLVVREPWSTGVEHALYKIIPATNSNRFAPFIGQGTVEITAGLRLVSGKNTRFTEQFVYGDKIVVGDESRVIIYIKNDTEMLVDSDWLADHHESFTIVPRRSGNEQLLVIYGGALASNVERPVVKPPTVENKDRDSFIDQRNAVNHNMYNSLRLAKKASPSVENIPGIVAVGPSVMLDGNLIKSKKRLHLPDYRYSAGSNPQPYQFSLRRNQELLRVEYGKNLLESNYWGNNIPGTHNAFRNEPALAGVNLLYYVSEEKSALRNVTNQPGWMIFSSGDESFLVRPEGMEINKLSDLIYLQPSPMPPDMLSNQILSTDAYVTKPLAIEKLKFTFTRLTTNTISMLSQKLFAGGLDNLLTIESQMLQELPFSRFYPPPGSTPPASVIPPAQTTMDFDGAYGLYFWEIFFHAPFLIAARLSENNRFEDAKRWMQYIFNPTQAPSQWENAASNERFWRFLPFRAVKNESIREILTSKEQIARYNYDPFDPDTIASQRQVAYAKTIVMRYIDNLISWGDYLFAQDTSESVNQATQLYLLAADLLGERPQSKGKRPTPEPKNFLEIQKEYQGKEIPQFLIDLENSSQSGWTASGYYRDVPFNDIPSYFCVPENADFIKYWDRVEDRLYKIRHCMNLDGLVRSLSLFAPPIDPRVLIRAIAAGGFGMALSSQVAPTLFSYRFEYLLEKAKALTGQLSALGSSLLSALEKKDAELLNLLRVQQEKTLLKMTTAIKEAEVAETRSTHKVLTENLNSATYRYQHYANLVKVGISAREQSSLDAALAAAVFNVLGVGTKTAASIAYAVPQVGSPFAMTYGGVQIGNMLNAASGVLEMGATISTAISQQTLTMAGYDRRLEDWTLQEKLASYEINQLKEQIKANEFRQKIAEQSLTIHLESIKQNEATELFYKDKFTNKELYQWLANRLSSVYFQTYTLAYDLALAAQRSYQFEFDTNRSFINFGYWDDRYKGLGAADGLLLALHQMENASIEANRRPLEIEKTISLSQLNPKALLDLKEKGECHFEWSERLFDFDFPGHYARKIKSVSVSIPAVVGPYQNIKATLTQLSNHLVLKSDQSGVDAINFLLGGKKVQEPGADVLRSNWWSNQQVVLSRGVNDNGLFEMSSNDSRYLPFEGTGAVSTWKLSMPKATNRLNFDTITDVIFTLRYTAYNGGELFAEKVRTLPAMQPVSGVGYFNLRQMYAENWFAFLQNHSSAAVQSLIFEIPNFVPPHIDGAKCTGFYIKLDTVGSQPGSYLTLQLTNSLSIDVQLGENNDFAYSFKANGKEQPAISKILGERRGVHFQLAATPEELKEGHFLDPTKLQNIQLILYYDGSLST
ncbi:neuraminidase-like domain-containing protein [Brevibacillus ruminantium]|uniref:Neuraminidase-like domain-containing protein n=1 Tax=Brevibacillus ruminantium TaxID=2950604 RepID=A0ABY4WFL0_9BACL|nr:neuraminidase-like domain-containing protein [Brevibacillus ruminantium]USG65946.1 neuraminidase-like domain-containing protein [Brevibacillus ruminantium]